MSIIGVKIYVTDPATALSCSSCPLLFQSDFPPQALPKDNIKTMIKNGILATEIWWCGKPYVKFSVEKDVEKMLLNQFKCKKIGNVRKEINLYLVDICETTKEPLSRFLRAKDLDCAIESIYITENHFEHAIFLKD